MKAMKRKLSLSKLRSNRIFVDFSLQCELELQDWCMVKWKMYWDWSKGVSASERLLWALIWDLNHTQPRSHFSWRVTWQDDFVTWKRQPTWYWIDTSWYKLTLSWHWTALHWRQAGGGYWHWHWDTMYNCYPCQRQSHIIFSKKDDYPIWKVGICYVTYILCYIPPLLCDKTMQHI